MVEQVRWELRRKPAFGAWLFLCLGRKEGVQEKCGVELSLWSFFLQQPALGSELRTEAVKSAQGLSSSWELVKGPFPLPLSLQWHSCTGSLRFGSASEGFVSEGTARAFPAPQEGNVPVSHTKGKRAGVETASPHGSGSLTGAVQRFHFSPQD